MPKSGYSYTEASELLAKAAHLSALAHEGHESTLTLEEVREAARAAGIDPSWVDRALVSDPVAPEPRRTLGMNSSIHRVAVVPHEVDLDEWGRMVQALRREFGYDGAAESIGSIHSWSHPAGMKVTVESSPEGTSIRADKDWTRDIRTLTWVGIGSLLMSAAFMAEYMSSGDGGLQGLSVLVLVLGLIFAFGTRPFYTWQLRSMESKLDASLTEMKRIASQSEERERKSESAVSEPATRPVILDSESELEAADSEALRQPSRTRTR